MSDESPYQLFPERNLKKVIVWPRNKDDVEPIEKMKILVWGSNVQLLLQGEHAPGSFDPIEVACGG